jgi:hypothetical protein
MTFSSNAECVTGSRRRGERGQTILLVAVSIVSLLAMAALAIDVVSLYVASTEIQRSADAAALAGAKAIVDSGFTTLQSGDGNLPAAQALAQDMATKAILAIVQASPPLANLVAGGAPAQVAGSPSFVWLPNNNPHVTVTLQLTNLPTFFARVWGSKSSIATASATAEAYNPSNLQNFTPIQTTCVKPWLIANSDPDNAGTPFVTPATGQVETPSTPLIGESFWLSADCNPPGFPACSNQFGTSRGGNFGLPTAFVYFVPLAVTAQPGDICPSSTASPCGGGNNPAYKSAIECCNTTAYSCGGTVPNATFDPTVNPEYQGANSDLALGTECLIHTSGTGLGTQDTLDWTTSAFPTGPPKITAGSGPQKNNNVSTSSSVVTIPILDNTTFSNVFPYQETVVGFLQAFVNQVNTDNLAGDVNITVLNVIGCSQTPNGNAPVIGGNGASPIPVRLITPP